MIIIIRNLDSMTRYRMTQELFKKKSDQRYLEKQMKHTSEFFCFTESLHTS